jgi:hypothetical protein
MNSSIKTLYFGTMGMGLWRPAAECWALAAAAAAAFSLPRVAEPEGSQAPPRAWPQLSLSQTATLAAPLQSPRKSAAPAASVGKCCNPRTVGSCCPPATAIGAGHAAEP